MTTSIPPKNEQEMNRMNFVFTSGASSPLVPGSENRRFCAIHAPKAKNSALYAQFGLWRVTWSARP